MKGAGNMSYPSDTALCLAARGFRVFPLRPGTKSGQLLAHWKQEASCDPADILIWTLEHDLNINFGIAVGEVNGARVMVMDLDAHGANDEELDAWWSERIDGHDFGSMWTRTPHGGRHIFVDVSGIDERIWGDEEVASRLQWELGKSEFLRAKATRFEDLVGNAVDVFASACEDSSIALDIRMPGRGYVVAPGSIVAGREYELHDGAVQPLPASLAASIIIGKLRGDAARARRRAEEQERRANENRIAISAGDPVRPSEGSRSSFSGKRFSCPDRINAGERNDMLYRYARSLCRRVSPEELRVLVCAKNDAACVPPLPAGEVLGIVSHALTQPDSAQFLAFQEEISGRKCRKIS